jgi:hypothetical protein
MSILTYNFIRYTIIYDGDYAAGGDDRDEAPSIGDVHLP